MSRLFTAVLVCTSFRSLRTWDGSPINASKYSLDFKKDVVFKRATTMEYELGNELALLREITRNTNQHTQETSTPDEEISVGLPRKCLQTRKMLPSRSRKIHFSHTDKWVRYAHALGQQAPTERCRVSPHLKCVENEHSSLKVVWDILHRLVGYQSMVSRVKPQNIHHGAQPGGKGYDMFA